ncbi:MAG: GspH/FimT family pseudopilin [Pseudomonadota bacterium]|nr:GspH/FimT family pseudopilin [Pseudomonadota bacterium]
MSKGFTLVELIVVSALVSILLAIASPSVAALIGDNRLSRAHNELLTHLRTARQTAVYHQTSTVVCATGGTPDCDKTDQWELGWMTFTDPNGDEQCRDSDLDGRCDDDGGRIIRVAESLPPGIRLRKTRTSIAYLRFDAAGAAGGINARFFVCDGRGEPYAKSLVISATGRVRTTRDADDYLRCA